MIAWLMQLTGLGRAAAVLIVALTLAAAACLGAWGAVTAYRDIIADAVTAAKAERDAAWEAQIANANAAVQQARAEQATVAARADAAVRDAEATFQTQLKELEKANAALPAGDRCGLGRDRVRLLNGAKP